MSIIEKAILLDDKKNKIKENKKIKKKTELKKRQELFFTQLYSTWERLKISEKGVEKCRNCGDFCMFLSTKNFDKMKLYKANFCGNRFCPTCAKRKSIKDTIALDCMTRWVIEEKKRRFIFLTLTVPNVSEDALDDKIREMNHAFHNLAKRTMFSTRIKGYVRKLELTYNKKTNSYHPHFHVLLSVGSRYFNAKNQYLSKEKWLKEWQTVMNDTDITQIDVKHFKYKKDEKSVFELIKYIAKDTQRKVDTEIFTVLYNTLHRKRDFAFGGDFKEARVLYSKQELTKYFKVDETIWYWLITFGWAKGEYKERQREKVSDLDLNIKNLVFKDCL